MDNDLIDFKRQLIRKPDQYKVGDGCGQIVIMKIPDIEMIEANELSNTNKKKE